MPKLIKVRFMLKDPIENWSYVHNQFKIYLPFKIECIFLFDVQFNLDNLRVDNSVYGLSIPAYPVIWN